MKKVRDAIFNHFWEKYRLQRPEVQRLEAALTQRGHTWTHDHFAILDITGIHTGSSVLLSIFETIGYVFQGEGQIPEKQNVFYWMAPPETINGAAEGASSQAVIADFKLEDVSYTVRAILKKYTDQAPPCPLELIKSLAVRYRAGDEASGKALTETIINYLEQRAWPLPTVRDVEIVRHENELIAWSLVYGRLVNHFTLAVHLLKSFESLEHFNTFLVKDLSLQLNEVGGTAIKGGQLERLEQSSTIHMDSQVALADGYTTLPNSFIEFIWRYPKAEGLPLNKWNSYFTGFVSDNAKNVVESLYEVKTKMF